VTGSLAGKTVLLVEDDEDGAYLLQLTFEREGANVIVATSVRAVDRVPVPVDLVVSDMHLPDGKATDVLDRLGVPGQDRPPAIALTGDAGPGVRERLHAAGFSVVLRKPVSPEVLLARARDLIAAASAPS